MHLIFSILLFTLISGCSTKYNSSHADLNKFNEDIDYCIKQSCKNKNISILKNITIISSTLAYGGGGGGGGGISSIQDNKISYKTFNACLKEKGYVKDKNGIFELPYITCK